MKRIHTFEQLLLRFRERNERREHRRRYHASYYAEHIVERRDTAVRVKRRRFAREVIAHVRQA